MNVLLFIICGILFTAAPAATREYLKDTAEKLSIEHAANFAYGALAAVFILLSASVALNTLLFSSFPASLKIMKIICGIYLLFLATRYYWKKRYEINTIRKPLFSAGFISEIKNPELIIFAFTIIPGFVLPHYSTIADQMCFVLLLTIICFISYAITIIRGSKTKTRLQTRSKTVNIIVSLFLIYSAIFVSGI